MRSRLVAVGAVCLALTACGGSGDDKKSDAENHASTSEEASAPSPEVLAFGKPATTAGDSGTGVLEITPTNVAFTATDGTSDAKYGMFAVITTKSRAMTGVAAEQTAPISNGGWGWIASDGQTISTLDGEATSVTIDRYNNAGPVEPGTHQLGLEVFDLTPKQTRGGTLIYRDGDGMAHKWKMPSKDTGPEVTGLKEELR